MSVRFLLGDAVWVLRAHHAGAHEPPWPLDDADTARRFLCSALHDDPTLAHPLQAFAEEALLLDLRGDGTARLVDALADALARGALGLWRGDGLGLSGGDDDGRRPAPPPVDPVDPTPPPEPQPDYDLVALRAPSHIASGTERIDIAFTVHNPDALATTLTLQILRKRDGQVLRTETVAAGHDHGPHTWPWDGSVPTTPEFPDGFATVLHSPYVVKVTLGGPRGDRQRTREVQVELVEFKVRMVLPEKLSEARDRAVYASIPYVPTSGKQRLTLLSDLYATRSEEMEDNTAFTAYRTLWGDGPRVPLEVLTRVRNSAGAAVPAGKALGNARVLWDYADAPRSRAVYLSNGAAAFVDRARAYDLAAGRPAQGDNAHVDRGGKRGAAAGGPAAFTGAQGKVLDFPYTVAPGGTRWWSAFSRVEKSGPREGQSGVVFRPARQAGDNYRLTAYLDLREALDTADVTPQGAFRQIAVGEFEVWRRITLRAHWKKCPPITAPLPSVTDYYADAYIDVDDRIGAVQAFAKAAYEAAFTAARAAVDPAMVPALVRQHSLVPGDQYDAPRPPDSFGGQVLAWLDGLWRPIANAFGLAPRTPTTWVATFRPYQDFRAAVRDARNWTEAQCTAALTNIGITTEAEYVDRCTDYAMEIATEMCKVKATEDGVTILQFDWTHSLEEPAGGGRLNGNAVFKTRSVSGFVIYNPRQDTTGHEIGHNMFLPHAPRLHANGTTLIDSGGGITPDSHDGADLNCLMSYARPRPGFCGLCCLRLAGWDKTAFDRNGPTVTK